MPELRFIASDPDVQHVFLLNSFNDAANFVDLLSFTTCDSKYTGTPHKASQHPGYYVI